MTNPNPDEKLAEDKLLDELRPVKGYEGRYAVTGDGRVWSYWYKKWIKPSLRWKYPGVTFTKNGEVKGYMVHRLVAEAFVPNPESKKVVDHKDNVRTNSHYTNLEWVTQSENIRRYYSMGHTAEEKKCTRCKQWKLRATDFYKSRIRYDGLGVTCKDCSRLYSKEVYARSKLGIEG